MSIIRVNKSEQYTVIANQPLNDERLSWEARGVLAYLLSKPDGWQVRIADLVNRGPAQRAKIRRILQELEGSGYLYRHQERGAGGTFGEWITEVYETPESNPHQRPAPKSDYPTSVKPTSVKPTSVNRPLVNTDPDQILIQANTDPEPPPPPNPQTADGRLAGGGGGHTQEQTGSDAGQDEQPQQDDPELAELADICQEIDGIDRPTAERLAAAARRHYARPAEAVGNLVDYVLAGGRLIRNPAGMLVKLVQSGQTRLPPVSSQQPELRQQIPADLLDIVRR